MKIAVVVSDAAPLVHLGGEIERKFRFFDCPPEMEAYILDTLRNEHASVSLAIEEST